MKPPKTKFKVGDKVWIANQKAEYLYGACGICEGAQTITVKRKEKNCRTCFGTGESKQSTKHTYYTPVSRKIRGINIRCDFEIRKNKKDNVTEIDIAYDILDPSQNWGTQRREYVDGFHEGSLCSCFGSREELLAMLKKDGLETTKPKQKKAKPSKKSTN